VIGTAALRKQQQAEDAIEGDRLFRIREGYDRLPMFLLDRFLAAGGRAHLDTAATAIEWKRGDVRVETASTRLPEVRAGKAVIALPLSVMQAGLVRISPEPKLAAEAMAALAMGSASRITLVFRERFWGTAANGLSFLFAPGEEVPVWWSSTLDASPTLTGWIGGPGAKAGPAGDALRNAAMATLGNIFMPEDMESLLLSWHTHDWAARSADPGRLQLCPGGHGGHF